MTHNASRIFFLGYGEIGVHCLHALNKAGAEIAAVLPRTSDTKTDSCETSVRSAAALLGLPVLPFASANDPGCIAAVSALETDFIVSVQYDRILKKEIIAVPKKGALNLHFALLPRLRGCFPTKWAILNNESAGVTLHYIDEGIDTGPIIDQTEVPLSTHETDASLYRKLVNTGKVLFSSHANSIARNAVPEARVQNNALSSYYPKKTPFNRCIDWTQPADVVERLIRAFTFAPYPAARTSWAGSEVQIRGPLEILETSFPGQTPGSVTWEKESCKVACAQGALRIRKIILPADDPNHELPVRRLLEISSVPPGFIALEGL